MVIYSSERASEKTIHKFMHAVLSMCAYNYENHVNKTKRKDADPQPKNNNEKQAPNPPKGGPAFPFPVVFDSHITTGSL